MRTVRTQRPGFLLLLILVLLPAPLLAKSYSAERFDSVVRVLPDGTLDVTEKVVFSFDDGTFREVFREIPQRRTDGLEVLSAGIQGKRLPFGTEPGTVELRRRSNRLRVLWRFGPTEGVTREFVLHYRVRGAIRQEEAEDLLVWRALPGEHQYRIASSTIRFELPTSLVRAPDVTARRAGTPQVTVEDGAVRIEAAAIRSNGWIDTALAFPRGSLITVAPAWQQRAQAIAAESPLWILSAALLAAAGLILLIAWRQGYDAPPRDLTSRGGSDQTVPPDALDPVTAGVLAANGRPALEHAVAALFSLAERGEIAIREMPRGLFGQREFEVSRLRSSGSVRAHEGAVLDTILKTQEAGSASVTLSKARSRLSMALGRFRREMTRELREAGLLDDSRKAVRDRYHRAAILLLLAGAAGFAPAGYVAGQRGGWPMLLPAALLGLALAAIVLAATITPLSNDGVRRAHRWREYCKHLKAVAEGKRPSDGPPTSATLTMAVALGLAAVWSKFLKTHAFPAPAWFQVLPGSDGHVAFPAFLAAGGAGAGPGSGGAAGGGASGAR